MARYGIVQTDGKSVTTKLLDGIMFPSYNRVDRPGYVNASSSVVFDQRKAMTEKVTIQQYSGVGYLELIGNEEDYPNASPKLGDAKTLPLLKYAKRLPISEDFRSDQLEFDVVSQSIQNLGENARKTEDKQAFSIFNNATSTNPLFTTGDGAALISDSHTTLEGATVDNNLTFAAATGTTPTDDEMAAAVEAMIIAMHSQPAQDGTVGGHIPAVLVVPPKLFATATRALRSELTPGVDSNSMNYLSNVYPNLTIVTNEFMGAAQGGSDDRMILLGDNNPIRRYSRQGINTRYVPMSVNEVSDHSFYLVSFRDLTIAPTWEGVVGLTFT